MLNKSVCNTHLFFEGYTNIDSVHGAFIQLIRIDYRRRECGEEKRNRRVKGCS